MTASWPDKAEIPSDPQAAMQFESMQRVVERLRNMRAEMGLQPSARLSVQMPRTVPKEIADLLLWYVRGDAEPIDGPSATIEEALDAVRAQAPRDVLLERYRKEAAHLESEIERVRRKLSDRQFVGKAPAAVVEREREKLARFEAELARRRAGLEELGEIA